MRHLNQLVLAPLCTAAIAAGSMGDAPTFTILDLGTLAPEPLSGAPGSQAYGMNATGDVVGLSLLADGAPELRAFRWSATMSALEPLLGDVHSQAFAINDGGIAVGVSFTLGELTGTATRWTGAALPVSLGAFAPRDLNNAGVVVGAKTQIPPAAYAHAVRWINGTLIDLGTLGGRHSSAHAINDAGAIVGVATLPGDLVTRAFFWAPGLAMTDLGTLGGPRSQAFDINDQGQVAGVADTPAGRPHAVLMTVDAQGQVTQVLDLGTLLGVSSTAMALNDAGDVVGTSDGRAFLWQDGTLHDLNELIPAGGGWVLTHATAINDAGQIAGYGAHDGLPRAFRLTPVIAADVNGDGVVDVSDLVGVILAWGPCPAPPAPCPTDVDDSGSVDVLDLIEVLLNWS